MLNKKGFLLLEIMLVLFGISVFLTLVVPTRIQTTSLFEFERFKSDYLDTQFNAMFNKRGIDFDDASYHFQTYSPLHFNGRGNVNQAQTIQFINQRKVIVELGAGRLVDGE